MFLLPGDDYWAQHKSQGDLVHVAKINTKDLFLNRPRSAAIDVIVSGGFFFIIDQVRDRADVISVNSLFIADDSRTCAMLLY